jgi:hypothetical protein
MARFWRSTAVLVFAVVQASAQRSTPLTRGDALMQTMLPNLLTTEAGRPLAQAYLASPIAVTYGDPARHIRAFENVSGTYFLSQINFNPHHYALADIDASRIETDARLRGEVARRLEMVAVHELQHWQNEIVPRGIKVTEDEVVAFDAGIAHRLERIRNDPAHLVRLPAHYVAYEKEYLDIWIRGPGAIVDATRANNPQSVFGPADEKTHSQMRALFEEARQIRAGRASALQKYEGAGDLAMFSQATAALEDWLAFWEDPARIRSNQQYYRQAISQMTARWRRWHEENPAGQIRIPTTADRGKAWLREKLGFSPKS